MLKKSTLKMLALASVLSYGYQNESSAQALRIPQNTNFACSAGRQLGATDIDIQWHSPGVKGRESKIWGTDIAPYDFTVLGFGSEVKSPWRAGADESTTISFSTDVKINGKNLAAGKYGFFIALYPDSCVLVFNKNTAGWGSYFYNAEMDILRVSTIQQKNMAASQERLIYTFSNQTEQSLEIALEWERWRIPFKVEVDAKATTLALIKSQMSGALGFDPASLEAAANWCLTTEVNYEEALNWINSATNPSLGGVNSFRTLSIKSKILEKLGRGTEATAIWEQGLDNANSIELHTYGRQLMAQKRVKEAMAIFEKNHKKFNGAWPTNVGMMRGYSGMGDLKKALEFAKLALSQAPDEVNKKSLEAAIKQLEAGKAL